MEYNSDTDSRKLRESSVSSIGHLSVACVQFQDPVERFSGNTCREGACKTCSQTKHGIATHFWHVIQTRYDREMQTALKER